MDTGGALKLIVIVAAYFLPTIIAAIRNHHQVNPIFMLNLLLGWTVLGWIAALIWAVSAVQKADGKGLPKD